MPSPSLHMPLALVLDLLVTVERSFSGAPILHAFGLPAGTAFARRGWVTSSGGSQGQDLAAR